MTGIWYTNLKTGNSWLIDSADVAKRLDKYPDDYRRLTAEEVAAFNAAASTQSWAASVGAGMPKIAALAAKESVGGPINDGGNDRVRAGSHK